MTIGAIPNAIVVPEQAVMETQGGSIVYVIDRREKMASTTVQQAIYLEIQPLLKVLRDEVASAATGPAAEASPSSDDSRPGNFFSGMEFEDLSGKKVPEPPAPLPRRTDAPIGPRLATRRAPGRPHVSGPLA